MILKCGTCGFRVESAVGDPDSCVQAAYNEHPCRPAPRGRSGWQSLWDNLFSLEGWMVIIALTAGVAIIVGAATGNH